MIGHSISDQELKLKELMKRIGATSVEDVLRFLGGAKFADDAQDAITGGIGRMGGATKVGGKVGRMAGGKAARNVLRAVPGLSTALVALDAADVVAGPDSLGNKALDAAAMGLGGFLGSAGGPLGVAAGASLGKGVSDIAQGIFGGGRSAEDRKIEEAIKLLQARGVI